MMRYFFFNNFKAKYKRQIKSTELTRITIILHKNFKIFLPHFKFLNIGNYFSYFCFNNLQYLKKKNVYLAIITSKSFKN